MKENLSEATWLHRVKSDKVPATPVSFMATASEQRCQNSVRNADMVGIPDTETNAQRARCGLQAIVDAAKLARAESEW